MKKNSIILTGGMTGSSVLTSLIAKAGYWIGDSTFKKRDYDTYENDELIKLNLRLMEEIGYSGDYTRAFCAEPIKQISSLYEKIDKRPYISFLQKCSEHKPWLWKDPRLWITVRFWKNLLNLEDTRFILLTRDHLQMWISSILRRQIQTYHYSKNYNESIKTSILDFFKENNLPYLHLRYEELIVRPEAMTTRLNEYLHTELQVGDLKKVYHGRLYKSPRSNVSLAKAILIYLKNYSERYK